MLAQQHFHRVALYLLESKLFIHPITAQAAYTREIPLLFSASAVGPLKSPVLG